MSQCQQRGPGGTRRWLCCHTQSCPSGRALLSCPVLSCSVLPSSEIISTILISFFPKLPVLAQSLCPSHLYSYKPFTPIKRRKFNPSHPYLQIPASILLWLCQHHSTDIPNPMESTKGISSPCLQEGSTFVFPSQD